MSPSCPTHRVPLDGGPVWFYCPTGHSVTAADLSNEFQAVTR